MTVSADGGILRNIRLDISYDGTNFAGWQKQSASSAARTVQGELEAALFRLHKKSIPLVGSGRTDAGVHAAGQVANFHTDIAAMPAERFVPALNSLLPPDVRILRAQEVQPGFHARFDARERTYRYFLDCSVSVPAYELPYCWPLFRRPDVRRLNSMASVLHGEMDCSVFAAAGDKSFSKSRFFYRAGFFPEGRKLVFQISANAFLWKMVRSILGTILDLEKKGASREDFIRIVKSGRRSLAGQTAPAKGLFLWNIRY